MITGLQQLIVAATELAKKLTELADEKILTERVLRNNQEWMAKTQIKMYEEQEKQKQAEFPKRFTEPEQP